ncbi:OsmC family protein [Flammeovirga kamogawensis]|uniref:OsmC family protein n=1 Tax=Flammeovirga kamogawensis TaxID=373891 RepID=A0ABX8GU18_9BACT|nr:OsmC family protein [Flammeovirga kamogawensis]MBB6459857.1 putative redox protein [Flammeovirga kamogawensis]QWG07089.1 OsmC family protein [Flammeovirga kamogawensis]TRX68910.1 OsmC family protein [Flammeovirga kamogawensis]
MKIELNRVNEGVRFEATSEEGNTLHIDAGKGKMDGMGQGSAFSPMQLVLTGVAGCAVFDLIHILKKQRQEIQDVKITIDGERKDAVPAPFETVNVHFKLFGDINEGKAERAVALAVEKYCSVAEMVKSTATITHSFEIIK